MRGCAVAPGSSATSRTFVLRHAGELSTLAAVRGAQGPLGVFRDAALVARDGRVVWVGREDRLGEVPLAGDVVELDVAGAWVTPGLVDPHTHAVFAGSRAAEFEARLRGASTAEIVAAGGGIVATVGATRRASDAELAALTRARYDAFLTHGTTTLEVKSGYGLASGHELRMLRAARVEHVVRRVYTHLGAHAVPPEYEGRPDEYVDLVCDEMLPAAVGHADFVDVFCDQGAFSVEQSRRVLLAARALGFGLKVHADELARSGGSLLAAELGCVSADHLVHVDRREIAALTRAGVVPVLLPGTSFTLGLRYAPAREFIAAGASIALATDFNPGTCYCENMQLVVALACRGMGLTPAEALQAITAGSAAAVGMSGRVGTLAPGAWCDLVVWNGEDHRELGYHFGVNLVDRVVVGGRLVVQDGQMLH